MKKTLRIVKALLRSALLATATPALSYQGYKRKSIHLGLPESHYFHGEDSLGSLNQIHKRYLTQTGWIESKNTNQSVKDGKYIPWTSYAFTHWLSKKRVFKFEDFGIWVWSLYDILGYEI